MTNVASGMGLTIALMVSDVAKDKAIFKVLAASC